MNLAFDAVVIGAGVIGTSTALELARTGRRVAVVDRFGGAGQGSTGGSSAIVRFNYSTLEGVATAWESKHHWEHWAEHLGGMLDGDPLARFHRTGLVMLDVPVAPRDRARRLFDRVRVPYELWTAAELATRVAGIDPGRFWPPKRLDDEAFWAGPDGQLGAVFTPDAGFVDDPALAAVNLAAAAGRHGVRFLYRRRVCGVRRTGGRVAGLELADGSRIDTSVVVNAAGPWSSGLNRLVGVGADFTVSVRPMRQEVHQVQAPAGFNDPAGSNPRDRFGPVIADLDLGTYLRAAPGDGLLVGGTEPACDPPDWLDDPDDANPNPTVRVFDAQVTRAARRLPGLHVPGAPRGIAGVYDVAADWTPIYDRTGLDGYYVAMGTSGNQFKNAPLVGRFMAAIVDAVEAGHDHDADPVGYRGGHTGVRIDLGAFSRKRALNTASSGTVMG